MKKLSKKKDARMKRNIMPGLMLGSACVLCLGMVARAQTTDGVIMTVDGEDVPSSEFIYLFNKNNVQQMQPQTLDEYLELFENYRLKVAEAKTQGVDTTTSFKKEIASYRRDLLEPYLTDSLMMQKLVAEALHRDSVMVESSHIMIVRTGDPEKDKRNRELLDSIRIELLNGADFIEAAKKHSQDRYSSDKGGYLGLTPAGYFPYAFETAVYETPEGEISEIVESHVGWHIVKSGLRKKVEEMDRKPRTYQEVKTEVERKSSSPFDTRYHQIRKNTLENLKVKHPEVHTSGMSDEVAYSLLVEAEEKYQYANNPDYRNLVDEYVNGSLLYAVSVENIWDKAANDEEGLQNLFQQKKNAYVWQQPHAKGIMVQAMNDSVAQEIKMGIANLPADSVVDYIRANFKKTAKAEKFNIEKGANALIDNMMFGIVSETDTPENNPIYFVVEGRIVEQPETLDDVRSVVTTDYQEILEKEWLKKLRNTHSVVWNRQELEKIRKSGIGSSK